MLRREAVLCDEVLADRDVLALEREHRLDLLVARTRSRSARPGAESVDTSLAGFESVAESVDASEAVLPRAPTGGRAHPIPACFR